MPYKVLLTAEFHGAMDTWTEYLCIQAFPNSQIELSSRSREALMGYGWSAGEIIWPESYDPDDEESEGCDVVPVSVAGKPVIGRDGDFFVGETLLPHADDAVAIFSRGQANDARRWLKAYGWADKRGFAAAWETIEKALS